MALSHRPDRVPDHCSLARRFPGADRVNGMAHHRQGLESDHDLVEQPSDVLLETQPPSGLDQVPAPISSLSTNPESLKLSVWSKWMRCRDVIVVTVRASQCE